MNPISSNIFPLPIRYNLSTQDNILKSGKAFGEYFSTPDKTARGGSPLNKGDLYLESLRQALLEKGKPLNKISLDSSDLPLFKRLLFQSGFSPENIDNLLKKLLKNSPCGGINLSQFFNQVTELSTPNKEAYQSVTLETSAIPYLESLLRKFDFTPKEVEHVLSGARVKGGKLDLNKFFINLENEGKKQAGIQSSKKCQLPADVKATIDRILERVDIANEKYGIKSSLFSFSKPGLTDLHIREKSSRTSIEKEGLVSFSKEKGGINAINGQQKGESSFSSQDARLFSDLDAGKAHWPRPGLIAKELNDGRMGSNKETMEKLSAVTLKTRVMDIDQNISGSMFLESVNTGKQNEEPARNLFPSYLIDQVGKQISRSILRGERIVRFQLKPAGLGTLKIEMDMKDNILKLGMITENGSVKELLLSNINELREALVQQGVKLERLDVQINHNFDQSLAHSKEGQKERQNQDHTWMPLISEGGIENPLLGSLRMTATNRLLDLVA